MQYNHYYTVDQQSTTLDINKSALTLQSEPNVMVSVCRSEVFINTEKHRKLLTKGSNRERSSARCGTSEPSSRTKTSLRKVLRNGEVSKTFITLTYSQQAAPSNDKELKRHISLWVNRVSRQGIRGLWVIEFTQKGIPHIHVLTPCEVDRLRITKAWQDVTGQRLPACVDIRTVYDATGLESYLGKMRTKLAPTSFGLVHRWYGVFGGFVRRVIISVATGTQSAIAPVLRLIRRIAHVSPNRKTLWGFSRRTGRTEAITRYARYLGVSP